MATAFPLQWPDSWPRTAVMARRRAAYKVTSGRAVDDLMESLRKLRAKSIVVSTNIETKRDGAPYANQKHIVDDPGVAVYWVDPKLGERVIACDRWVGVYDNVRAVWMALEALRAIERAGATQILERAFSAFGALPAPKAEARRPWWEVLDIPVDFARSISPMMLDARFLELAAIRHPDKLNTGSKEAFQELQAAYEEAKKGFSDKAEGSSRRTAE